MVLIAKWTGANGALGFSFDVAIEGDLVTS